MQIFFPNSLETMIHQWISRAQSLSTFYKQWDNLPVHSRWWVVTLWHTSWQTHFIRAPAPASSLCQRIAHSRCNNKMMPNLYLSTILIVSILSIGGTGDKINGMISEICIITILSLPKINYLTSNCCCSRSPVLHLRTRRPRLLPSERGDLLRLHLPGPVLPQGGSGR